MTEKPEAVLVTFPGHYLVPLAWLLTRRPRTPLFFDAFISLSDSLVSDRRKVSWLHPYAWFLYLLDFLSCHLSDRVIVDTASHAEFFARAFVLRRKKIDVVYLETRKELFFPKPKSQKGKHVLFYGTYIPLQGIDHIIRAAKLLEQRDPHITFELIGSGQTEKQIRTLADELQVRNCTFHPSVPLTELPERIRNAGLCLGIFGNTKKAARVIPHKVYDAVACGIPVLTRESDAVREKFSENDAVYFCQAANPEDLAEHILKIVSSQ